VQIWEDFEFLAALDIMGEREFEPLSEQQSARLMDQLAECPLLQRIVRTYVWADYVGLTELRYLLNLSWDELRPAICCFRPIFSDGLPALHQLPRFIHNSKINPASSSANISTDLAFGCIRVRQQIETGNLPEALW
jgi:hypothetical protein